VQAAFMVSGSQIGCPRADQNLAKITEVGCFAQADPLKIGGLVDRWIGELASRG